jgi:hypothetical protein
VIQISRLATIIPDAPRVTLPERFMRYALVDRGSYEYADDVAVPPALVALASEVTARTLRVVSARVLRLVPGDYVLAHHDPLHDDHRVEVMVDHSSAAVEGAEVRYQRRGATFFRFPSQPGAMSIVERDPATRCHHTYVSKLLAGAVVIRVVVQLVDAG